MSKTYAVGDQVRLRPIEEHHLTHLVRLLWDVLLDLDDTLGRHAKLGRTSPS